MLQKISLTQFRNFGLAQFDIHSKAVAITGLNGVGKTNILDAIYYLCFTKSHFNSKEKYNIQHHTNGFRIEGDFDNNSEKDKIVCIWKEGKKTISFNNIPYEKLSEHIGKYNAIMIAPDDTALITGSSELRRKFFDSILSIQDTQYLEQLMLYQKIIAQKNAYLKNIQGSIIDHTLLDIYDQQLIAPASYLVDKRWQLKQVFPDLITKYYALLCNEVETASLTYKSCCEIDALSQLLFQSRNRDLEYRRATFGPHTEDWEFMIKGIPCKNHASQGQKKSYLISLKLAQLEILSQKKIQPILLLDDIFEKLDPKRIELFFQILNTFDFQQIFLTHTNISDIKLDALKKYDTIQNIQLD